MRAVPADLDKEDLVVLLKGFYSDLVLAVPYIGPKRSYGSKKCVCWFILLLR